MGWLRDNPVLVRELRIRMRGAKAYWLMLAYVLVAASLTAGVGAWFAGEQRRTYGTPPQGDELGRVLFMVLMIGLGAMVCLSAPGLSSAMISSERERQTYGLLRITLLKAFHIVAGKLISSLSALGLLMLSLTPFTAMVFLYGGVSFGQMALGYFTLIAAGLYFGAAGLWWSSVCRRTATSSVGAYGTMLAFVGGGPLVALLLVLATEFNGGSSSTGVEEAMMFFLSFNPAVHVGLMLADTGSSSLGYGVSQHWPVAGVCYLVLTLLTILLTTLKVQQQTE
jgi:ABC-type transport system involved in multi-copper enzyme maturation permease subunit